MKSGKGHQENEEDEYGEFAAKKDTPPSNTNRDGKNSEKASATRSKHSVTEQRRRSKINERFQTLRDLIPNSDQKRDTASFLLEVIDYVQYLQEKVQKYEGSYQGWSQEPTKLMPWRNSHWRVQNFVSPPPAINNDCGPGSSFSGRLDDNNVSIAPSMHIIPQNQVETDPTRDPLCKSIDRQPEQLGNKTMVMPMPMPLQASISSPSLHGDGLFPLNLRGPISEAPSADVPISNDALNQHEELTIEGGTINISSVYSEGLLNTLTDALQNAGVDLSQATISVQVDLGKRANRGLTSGIPIAKDHENPEYGNQPVGHFQDARNGDDSDRAQKRMKI